MLQTMGMMNVPAITPVEASDDKMPDFRSSTLEGTISEDLLPTIEARFTLT